MRTSLYHMYRCMSRKVAPTYAWAFIPCLSSHWHLLHLLLVALRCSSRSLFCPFLQTWMHLTVSFTRGLSWFARTSYTTFDTCAWTTKKYQLGRKNQGWYVRLCARFFELPCARFVAFICHVLILPSLSCEKDECGKNKYLGCAPTPYITL